jgi:hypothetical protein
MKLELNEEQLKNILFEDDEDYEAVTFEKIIESSRWSYSIEQVFKRVSDNTFWQFSWSRGATEMQNEGPEGIVVYQVFPKEVTRIEYVRNYK